MLSEDLKECPFYLITRASLAATAALKEVLAAAEVSGLRPAYLGVLMTLWHEDRLKVVELGRRVGLEPSSMTGLLDRMERDGFLVRTPDPEDRRAQRIQLTEQGHRARQPATEVTSRALDRMFAGIPPEDLDHLKGTLRRVLENTHRRGAP